MPDRSIGFGLIGTGMIAGYHAQAIHALIGGKLVGVAGRSPEKTAAFAAEHNVPLVTTNIRALLERSDIDVICITTPSGAHLNPALDSIAAGKHVVIEKPLEITTERIDRILAAASRAKVVVAPIFQARFGPGAKRVKSAVDARRLGRIVNADLSVKWHRTAAYYSGWKGTLDLDGGGVLINQAIHGIDLLQWFVGLPAEVFAWSTRRVHEHIEGEDTVTAALRFSHGGLGSIVATTATWPGWARRIELNGERGSICLDDDQISRWEFIDREPGDELVTKAAADPALRSGATAPNAISFAGHLAQLQDLVNALREGRQPVLSGPDGRRAVALVEALYRTTHTGRPSGLN